MVKPVLSNLGWSDQDWFDKYFVPSLEEGEKPYAAIKALASSGYQSIGLFVTDRRVLIFKQKSVWSLTLKLERSLPLGEITEAMVIPYNGERYRNLGLRLRCPPYIICIRKVPREIAEKLAHYLNLDPNITFEERLEEVKRHIAEAEEKAKPKLTNRREFLGEDSGHRAQEKRVITEALWLVPKTTAGESGRAIGGARVTDICSKRGL